MSSKNTIKLADIIAAEGVSPAEIEQLLDIAAYAVNRMSMARRAEFDVSEFRTAKARGISDFNLIIYRGSRSTPEIWFADFTSPGRRLCVRLSVKDRA